MEKQIRVKPRERWTCTSLYIKKKDILGVREEVRPHSACTTDFLPGEGSIYTLRVSLGLSQSKCTERTVMGTRPVELSEGALMKPRKKRKEEKKKEEKKGGRTAAGCTAVRQAQKMQAVFSETEREKSNTGVNGNCSKIIECMSKCSHLPASNKYTACKSKRV